MPEENPFKIVLEYDMWSAYRIKKYKKWFKKHLDKGDKIPAYVIKRFISIFKTEEELQKVKKGLIEKITADTMQRFNKYGYDFKFETPPLPKVINLLDDDLFFQKSYSMEDMIKCVLWEMVNLEGKEMYKTKEEFIFHAYDEMCKYQKERKVEDEELKTHKKYILSAYLAFKVGFGVSFEKNPSPIQLRDAGRNAVTKYQKDKEKKVR